MFRFLVLLVFLFNSLTLLSKNNPSRKDIKLIIKDEKKLTCLLEKIQTKIKERSPNNSKLTTEPLIHYLKEKIGIDKFEAIKSFCYNPNRLSDDKLSKQLEKALGKEIFKGLNQDNFIEKINNIYDELRKILNVNKELCMEDQSKSTDKNKNSNANFKIIQQIILNFKNLTKTSLGSFSNQIYALNNLSVLKIPVSDYLLPHYTACVEHFMLNLNNVCSKKENNPKETKHLEKSDVLPEVLIEIRH